MATGVNPGRHGIFGFLSSTAQEQPQIAHSGLINATPIWRYLNELGLRAGIYNVPMTYPPASVEGFLVSGGLAAGWTKTTLPHFSTDGSIGRLVEEVSGGSYPLDTVVSYENDWHQPRMVDRITDIQKLRRRVLRSLLEANDIDFLFAVFEGPDRLQHLHYQYLVDGSEWFQHREAPEVRERAFDYFSELDAAIADLAAWAGSGGQVVVVSDHGFGPWEKTFNLNLLLEEWGYLRLPGFSRVARAKLLATHGQRLARRLVPRRLLHAVKSGVGRRIEWSDTKAFASHVAEQGIHINALDGLPSGILDSGDVSRVELELIERLNGFVDPDDGQAVVDEIVRRADVIQGPHSSRAPHLFPFCRDQRYELSDTLAASSVLTDHRDRPWGYHHKEGVFIAAGPGVRSGQVERALDIVDILPTAFHLGGLSVPDGLDGSVRTDILTDAAAAKRVTTTELRLTQERKEANPYSPEEEAQIEESLRGLGYVE